MIHGLPLVDPVSNNPKTDYAQSISFETYSVRRIADMILFGLDGTILQRNFREYDDLVLNTIIKNCLTDSSLNYFLPAGYRKRSGNAGMRSLIQGNRIQSQEQPKGIYGIGGGTIYSDRAVERILWVDSRL